MRLEAKLLSTATRCSLGMMTTGREGGGRGGGGGGREGGREGRGMTMRGSERWLGGREGGRDDDDDEGE